MDTVRTLSIISFTENGKRLSVIIKDRLEEGRGRDAREAGIEAVLFTKHRGSRDTEGGKESGGTESGIGPEIIFVEDSVGQWVKEQMESGRTMVFIGACGIAVRAIAPHIADKLSDSPVLVMDEKGRYVIPILSGHMGGANELAWYLAKRTGAEPVITTATDLNGRFAVDLFARRNGLFIVNREGIAKVSSRVLDRKPVTVSIEPGHVKPGKGLPEGLYQVGYPPIQPADIVITSQEDAANGTVVLRPKEYVIGIGCRRGKDGGEIASFILRELDRLHISVAQIWAAASVDQKRGEKGIVEWCQKERIPFFTYTAQELREVEGNFNGSSFVEETVGVDNVCERAALRACGPGGELVRPKYGENGMTIAVARREWAVDFDEE